MLTDATKRTCQETWPFVLEKPTKMMVLGFFQIGPDLEKFSFIKNDL